MEMSEHNGCLWKKSIDDLKTIIGKKVLLDENSMSSPSVKKF